MPTSLLNERFHIHYNKAGQTCCPTSYIKKETQYVPLSLYSNNPTCSWDLIFVMLELDTLY